MNILVCLKLISQQSFADTLSDSDDRLTSGQLTINPADMYALELALRIKDVDKDCTVTVLSMAPKSAHPSLISAIACGADRAVLISDIRLAGSDTLATAKVLAAAVKQLGAYELILCGRKSMDSETAHIGPQLATLLKLPLAANVLSFSVIGSEISFLCAEDGCMGEYQGKLPCLMSICNGTDMVRIPTVSGMRRAKKTQIIELDADALDLNIEELGVNGSATRTIGTTEMEIRRGKGCIAESTEVGINQLLHYLREETAHE